MTDNEIIAVMEVMERGKVSRETAVYLLSLVPDVWNLDPEDRASLALWGRQRYEEGLNAYAQARRGEAGRGR